MKRIHKILTGKYFSVCLITLIIAVFFIGKWTTEGPYFKNDSALITIPLENLYSTIQRSGQSPLWAPELAGGYPLLAIGQMGFWYPPHVLLRQFFPAVVTLNISLLMHAILASLGTFLFLKHNNVGISAAFAASILLSLSPVFVAKYEMLNLVLPFTWLPLILFLIQLSTENISPKRIILITCANIMLVLTGHPQMILYVIFAELFFIAILYILNRHLWQNLLIIGASILIAIGISSFSLLPIIDNLPNTDRANGSSDDPYEFQLTPASLLGTIIAHPFGHDDTYKGPKNEAELASYIGPFAFLFSLIGLFSLKKNRLLFYVSVLFIVTGLVMGLGELSPIYRRLIGHGFNYFSSPARFYFLVHFGLVFFAAFGIDRCLFRIRPAALFGRRIFAYTFIALAIIPSLYFSFNWTKNIPWENSYRPAILASLQNEKGVRIAAIPKENLIDMSPDNDFGIHAWKPITNTSSFRQTFNAPYSRINGISIKLSTPVIGNGKLSFMLATEKGQIIRKSSIFANKFVADDWNTFHFEPVNNAINSNYYFELTSDMPKNQAPLLYVHTNPQTQYDPTGDLLNCSNNNCIPVIIKQPIDADFKIITEKEKRNIGFETIAGHVASAYQLDSTLWIGALPILDVKNFFIAFEKGTIGNGDLWPINRFSTKHIIGIFPAYRFIENESLQLVDSTPLNEYFIRLYRNNDAFPRLAFFKDVKAATGSAEQLDILKNMDPKNRDVVVADTEKDLYYDTSNAESLFIKDERTKIEIQTENNSDGFLVLRDIYLKGWNATIDGEPARIYRTDSIFRGVLVPAGNHIVSFHYKPSWIKTATIIVITSFLALLGLTSLGQKTIRKTKKSEVKKYALY